MRRLISSTFLAGAMLASLGAVANAQEVKLRMSNWIASQAHPISIALHEWADKVEKDSDGRIQIDVDGAPIGGAKGQYDLIRNGATDIGWGLLSLTPGRFELSQVIELPFLSPSGEKGSVAATRVYNEYFAEKEFNDTKLLAIHVHGPGHLHTKGTVKKRADMSGLKIRTVGGGVPWVEALGATPVVQPASESHESLARGITDGILFPWQAIQAYRLEELVTHHLTVDKGLYTVSFFFAMNSDKYNSLPDDLKAVIDANSGEETAAFMGRAWDAADTRALDVLSKDPAHEITEISPSELAEWTKQSEPIIGAWKTKAEAAGVDVDSVFATISDATN